MKIIRKREIGQAVIELALISVIFIVMLFGTYVLCKIVIARQSASILARNSAFDNSYGKKKLSQADLKSVEKNDSGQFFELTKNNSKADGKSKFINFFGKLADFLANTKRSKARATITLDKEYYDFLKVLDRNIKVEDTLFMDEGTFEHSGKLKSLLYGAAFLKTGFSKGTKLESIGKDLLDGSNEAQTAENISWE